LAAAALAVAGVGAGFGAGEARAEDQVIEWSVSPADQTGPDGRISLRHELAPGASAEDAIAVTNLSAAAATFTVQTGAGAVGEDEAFDILAPDPAGPGGWVEVGGLDAGTVTLEAGETRRLPVTITVPAGAAPGDQPVGIAVGVSQGEGVTVTHRIGVRVHLRVAGEVRPELTVSITSARFRPSWVPFAPGRVLLEYRVENTGNVRLGAKVASLARGPLGVSGSSALTPVEELLPGDAVDRSASVPAPALFWLRESVTATPLVLGEDQMPAPGAAAASTALAAVSWTGLALLLALAGWAALALGRRKRRGARGRKPAGQADA
jgi:hypothetical protein